MSKCSQSSLPDFAALGAPADINVGFVPANHESLAGMKHCCSPNPVNKADNDCVLWCELPDSFMNSKANGEDISLQLKQCFEDGGVNTTEILITAGHKATSAAPPGRKPPSLGGLALLVLFATGILGPIF